MTLSVDTIVAIATPPGRGGIGIVRLSGPDALRIAEKLVPVRKPIAPRTVCYGHVLDAAGDRIDDALLTWFPAPHSYTGEETAEIAAHGSPVVLQTLVERSIALGARLAAPGEFTERAFLRGRLDLTQAEAVRDLIDAQTLAQARLAAAQLGGSLARQVQPVKQQLVSLIAELEAGIDFAEDDLDVLPADAILKRIAAMQPSLQALVRSFAAGRLLREGIRLAIIGRPNAGKSSLFNRLLERDRAIVTPIAGTTRDVVSERTVLEGIPVELLDTAGLRETDDQVERIGVSRSREASADADVVLLVADAVEMANGGPLDRWIDATTMALLEGRPWLLVRNKIDLLQEATAYTQGSFGATAPLTVIDTSAVTGKGMDELRAAILRAAKGSTMDGVAAEATLTNLRQHGSVVDADISLANTITAVSAGVPHEMLLLSLYDALRALDELTGTTTPDDVLNHIFSTFCIGK